MSTSTEDEIVEIGIDREGKLYVRPKNENKTFPYIWRAGLEINWDPARGVIYGAKPRNLELRLPYTGWFRHILMAAEGECGVRLSFTAQTKWTDIPDALRSELERAL